MADNFPVSVSTNEVVPLAYKDSAVAVEKRVSDLLSRMTLEEKVWQMISIWHQKKNILINEEGKTDIARLRNHLRNGLGQITTFVASGELDFLRKPEETDEQKRVRGKADKEFGRRVRMGVREPAGRQVCNRVASGDVPGCKIFPSAQRVSFLLPPLFENVQGINDLS